MNEELFPCQAILAARGRDALCKLLPLTEDKNPNVRLIVASFAYDAAPAMYRRVLEELMREPSGIAVLAWAILVHKNLDAPPDPELIGQSSAADDAGDKPPP